MTRRRDNLNDDVTPVIFRKDRTGDVVALFPYIAGDFDGWTCQSFRHIGQHGSADPAGVVRRTSPASEVEAYDLIVELTSAPYFYRPLRILRRFPPDSHAERRRQTAREVDR